MKIAIVGAGFTGLAAAYKLTQSGHDVTIFEKEAKIGGLAGTFKLPGWEWELEKHYHHWFTNDTFAIELIKEVGLGDDLVFPKTRTSIYYEGIAYPFNSALDVLKFSPLSFPERIRTGMIVAYLKFLSMQQGQNLEKYTAHEWLTKAFGEKIYRILWKPLLFGKFGPYAEIVNMAWFWARIKKRTPRLGYLAGGYHRLMDKTAEKIKEQGGKIILGTPFDPKQRKKFDKVIITAPSMIFLKMFSNELPQDYQKRVTSIPHLHALNLLLITKEKILPDIYWLNVNDRSFPFIAVVQQTSMIDSSHYNGQHITWVGNYLPPDHPYLKMSKEELIKKYLPYLKKINPKFNLQLTTHNSQLFFGPFAQPVFPVNYSRLKPDFQTPVSNVYLANMDMVYPWDRGTNYAIELGYKAAEIVEKA